MLFLSLKLETSFCPILSYLRNLFIDDLMYSYFIEVLHSQWVNIK